MTMFVDVIADGIAISRDIGDISLMLVTLVLGIPDLPDEHEGVCKGCALGKNSKHFLPSNSGRSKGILDLVH